MSDMKIDLFFNNSRAIIEMDSTPEMNTVALTVREMEFNEEKSNESNNHFEEISVTEVYISHQEAETLAESLQFLAQKNGSPNNE